MPRFADQVAFISGAARELGNAMAERFAAEGPSVPLADADAVAEEIARDHGVRAHAATVDVRSSAQVQQWIRRTVTELGRSTFWSTTPVIRDNRAEDISDEDRRRRRHRPRRCLLRHPRRTADHEGAVLRPGALAVLDDLARELRPRRQAGIVGLTRTVALEGARHGITANAIAPGLIDTPMPASMNRRAQQKLIAKIPVGHTGIPHDIAEAAAFLCSPQARFVTGVDVES
ncbi:SDR family NAD(P)-dependent oxidoreductase [Actinomadura rugatobispora]|uniref:SDR family NAD(P)-dependent oxidoreductase n=1 Tax=Actinomadura rugatobispora TaxID=1994 RepID=A0ABW0ZTH3_9ACTN|nr:SDR family NAD(P)-dependent oxidoreductase [Actinomadura rugatobispora]